MAQVRFALIGSRQKMVTDIIFTLFDQEEVLKDYFVNMARKRIAVPPCLALILSGRQTGGPPYSVTDDRFDFREMLRFEGEEFLWP